MVSTAKIAPFAILGLIGLYPAALAEAQTASAPHSATITQHVGAFIAADPDDDGPPQGGSGSAPGVGYGWGDSHGSGGCVNGTCVNIP